MNTQPAEKKETRSDGSLWIHSIFDTIQGEGPYAGVPATFIRTSGCNLQCPLCDTEYSQRKLMTLRQIREQLCQYPQHSPHGKLVVITGGEPFRQDIGPLVRKLIHHGFRVQVETNGTLFRHGPWTLTGTSSLMLVCSPKTPKINEAIAQYVTAFKYVVDAGNIAPDGLPFTALEMNDENFDPLNTSTWVARPPKGFAGPIYIQPLDEKDAEKNKANEKAAIQSCMTHGHTLCLQIHKIIGLE